MKKKYLFLLFPLLIVALTGCVKYNGKGKSGSNKSNSNNEDSSAIVNGDNDSNVNSSDNTPISSEPSISSITSSSNSDELPKGNEVKIYLVFGPNGLYKGNVVGTNVEALFLEHAMEYSAQVGDKLPTAEDVTSSVSNSKFVAWISYNNDGKLTEYTLVPGYQNKILYASFSGGSGSDSSNNHAGGGITDPITEGDYEASSSGALPTSGYGFKFSDDTYMAAVRTNDDNDFNQYLIKHKAFSTGQTFQLYDFATAAGWTVSIDPYSFGGDSDVSTNWKSYLIHDSTNHVYKVVQDFNVESIYIKLKYGEDQIYFQLAN